MHKQDLPYAEGYAGMGWEGAALSKKGGPGEINSAFCSTICHN